MGDIPRYITSADWANLSRLLFPLWRLVGGVFGFAGSMLLAHAVIPSLATSRDLPDPRLVKLRPPLYLGAALFLLLAIFAVTLIVDRVGVLREIFRFRIV